MRSVSPDVEGYPDTVVAENQEQYKTLVTTQLPTSQGTMILTRWKLTDEERRRIAQGEDFYVSQLNFGGPMTPMAVGLRDTFIEESSNG